MWLDGIGFAPPLEDPTKSRIVGKVGYGVMPAGPEGAGSGMFADGEGISTYSKKKGPAWFYLPVGVEQGEPGAACCRRRRRAGAQLRLRGTRRRRPTSRRRRNGSMHAQVGGDRASRACR